MLTRFLRGWRRRPTPVLDRLLDAEFRRTICAFFCAQDGAAVERALAVQIPAGTGITVAFDARKVQHPASCCWSLETRRGSHFTFPTFQPGQLLEVVVERWLSLFDVFLAAQTKAEHDGWTMISFNDLGAEPGLAFCGNKPAHILLPDFAFLQSRGYEKARAHFADNQPPWEERSSRVFWRGSSVGQKHHPILEMPRARLCLLAREMGDAWGDIGMVELFHISDEDAAELRRQGFVKDKVAWKDLSRYRFHIDIDGHAASYAGLFRKLLSGGLVLKVQSPDRCVQWYYDRLVPGLNFVPVREDLSDLVEVVAYYRKHAREAEEIARRGRALAVSLTYEKEFAFGLQAVAKAFEATES